MPSFARVKEKLDLVGQKILGPVFLRGLDGTGKEDICSILYIYIFITWKIDIIIIVI